MTEASDKSKTDNLHEAKRVKNDEFYTQLEDIEKEVEHYEDRFKDKVVLCNCDDPTVSKFFDYFSRNFDRIGLKQLIATCYKSKERDLFSRHDSEQSIYLMYDGEKKGDGMPDIEEIGICYFEGDGDFRSEECIELLKQADIVCTNPPFSLFREYVSQLMEYDKNFLIVGSMNAISYKEIFPLIKNDKIWLGNRNMSQDMLFDVPPNYAKFLVENRKEGSSYKIVDGVVKGRLASAAWFTNLEHSKRNENLRLCDEYSPDKYPKYDNYDAIEVSKVAEIPIDYDGLMGVPITFLGQYNPNQFEIIDINPHFFTLVEKGLKKLPQLKLTGKKDPYARIIIKHRRKG